MGFELFSGSVRGTPAGGDLNIQWLSVRLCLLGGIPHFRR